MNETIKKIKDKMHERNYWLYATSGDEKILYYGTPIEEKPHIACEIYVKDKDAVEFKFRYLTKNSTILTTGDISCFFNDEHFNKFESNFLVLARELYNFENCRK